MLETALGRPKRKFEKVFSDLVGPKTRPRGGKNIVGNSSWPVQEEFQDRFKLSWGPKGFQKGGLEGPKIELERRLDLNC